MQRVSTASAATALPPPALGGTPGYFAKPDPLNNIAATVPGHDWFNTVQEEICNVVTGAGLTLDTTKRDQLLQAIRTPGLFSTPPQFDDTQKVATTAFVKRALGNFAGNGLTINSDQTIPASVAGLLNHVNSSSIVTLPIAPPEGSIYHFYVNNTGTIATIRLPEGYTFGAGSSATTADIVLTGEEYFSVFYPSSKLYYPIGGLAAIKRSPQFAGSLWANGYQKLPSGLIIQWGSANTSATSDVLVAFPIAFPSFCCAVVGMQSNSGTGGGWIASNSQSKNGFVMSGWSAVSTRCFANVSWLAIGY